MAIDEAEFRAVADELAIRGLVARYADAASRSDLDAWIGTWAADGRWDVGGRVSEGHVDLRATLSELMALFERVVQFPQEGVIEIDGDAATGRWAVIEFGKGVSGAPSTTIGSYHDTYRREATGWRFAERRFEIIYAGPPDLSGAWLG